MAYKYKILNLFNILLLNILVVACVKPGVEVKKIYCPKPAQNCQPTIWNGISIDTVSTETQSKKFYFVIEKVKNINTNSDEWQLGSAGNTFVLTYTDYDRQKAMTAKYIAVNELNQGKGINFPLDKHFGSITGSDKSVLLSISNLSTQGNSKTPIDDAIGNSRILYGDFKDNNLYNLSGIIDEQFIEPADWYGHPSIHPNENIVFFSSDREGGFGGNDIWYSYRMKNNKWSKPVNCGMNINTECDEITPFVTKDGRQLLFSSSGNSTVGGYDIFKSNLSDVFSQSYEDPGKVESNFSKSINLGKPLNTDYDEIFPFSNTSADSVVYYSSNQNGSDFDIYVMYKKAVVRIDLTKKEPPKKNEKPKVEKIIEKPVVVDTLTKEKITLTGSVVEFKTDKPVDSARIDILKMPEKIKQKSVFSDRNGKFEVDIITNTDYQMTAHKDQFFYDTKDVNVEDANKKPLIKFQLPIQGIIRINFPLDEYKNPYKFTLDSMGYETGRTWQEELDLVAENILLTISRIDKVVLVGHTDDLASEDYNVKLGERRVDFVIAELIKRGVPKNVLIGRSAGESELLNKLDNETMDNYRKRLRRVTLEKYLK